jgi:T4 bacteriophage base plate protein
MLPKIKHPLYDTELPSTGKKISYRPMLGREEKILLMGKESKIQHEIMRSVKQVVQNCIVDNVDVEQLPTSDVDYMFVKLRLVSIGQEIDLTYTEPDTKKEVPVKLNLSTVTVKKPTEDKSLVKINDTQAIKLRFPTAEIYGNPELVGEGDDVYDRLIVHCMDKIIDGDNMYNVRESTFEESVEFLDQLPIEVVAKIREFLNDIPHVYAKLDFKDTQGRDRSIEFRSLTDFFIL